MFKIFCLLGLSLSIGSATVVQLNEANANEVLGNAGFSLVNFYADWCHFSQALSPIIEDAGKKLKQEFPDNKQLIIAKVDCDREVNLAQLYKVNKYPTLKVFRFGQMQKREYRGQRSVEAISEFIKSQMVDNVVKMSHPSDAPESAEAAVLPIDKDQPAVVGFFTSNQSAAFGDFNRVASMLRDDCKFVSVVASNDQPEKIVYQKGPDASGRVGLPKLDADSIKSFVLTHCVPLVREITFQNAEELTEEGLPFFILFYQTGDTATVDAFKSLVEKHLVEHRRSVNFLIGQGTVFSHPLHHLGKTVNDLPVLAIDSFKHMYVFPHNVRESLQSHPGRFAEFIADLHSGKLHREFHHGPDPSTAAPPAHVEVAPDQPNSQDHAPRLDPPSGTKDAKAGNGDGSKLPTSPPKSIFKHLSPSRNRYTILRDEL